MFSRDNTVQRRNVNGHLAHGNRLRVCNRFLTVFPMPKECNSAAPARRAPPSPNSLTLTSLTHTAHLEYGGHADRRADQAAATLTREGAVTLAALDKDLEAQQALWCGHRLHVALLQGECEQAAATLAEAVIGSRAGSDAGSARSTDQGGATMAAKGTQATKGKRAAPSKPKGRAQLVESASAPHSRPPPAGPKAPG